MKSTETPVDNRRNADLSEVLQRRHHLYALCPWPDFRKEINYLANPKREEERARLESTGLIHTAKILFILIAIRSCVKSTLKVTFDQDPMCAADLLSEDEHVWAEDGPELLRSELDRRLPSQNALRAGKERTQRLTQTEEEHWRSGTVSPGVGADQTEQVGNNWESAKWIHNLNHSFTLQLQTENRN